MIIKTYIQTADYYKTITTIVRRRDDRDTMASKSSKDTWSKKCGGEYNRITDIMHRSKSEKRKLIKAKRILNNLNETEKEARIIYNKLKIGDRNSKLIGKLK